MLRLVDIDRYNFRSVLGLSVFPEQESLVASNEYSLAQAYAQPECVPLGLYIGNTPVGFAMYCLDPEDRQYWIDRLMIDRNHQRRGYGREAMLLLISRIRALADERHNYVYISFEHENTAAKSLYESLGFVPDGREIDGEIVYRLKL